LSVSRHFCVVLFFLLATAPFNAEAATSARERIVFFDVVAVFDPSGMMEVTKKNYRPDGAGSNKTGYLPRSAYLVEQSG
jgi:hypothetical protein